MQNKTILVTGGYGFIGSHFVELLLKKCTNTIIDIVDAKTYCYSTKTYRYIKDLASETSNTINFYSRDIRFFTLPKERNYDYIVNFAAESHVDNSISNGYHFLTTNIEGTFNLLNQLKDNTRFVQISTDEVYGSLTKDDRSSLEDDILAPSSMYSATKASADLIALSFYKTHKKNVIVTRCCNNFGPRQYTEKFIPKAINSLLKLKTKISLYGSGDNIRQWIYVGDHCKQVYDIMINGNPGEIYNIEPTYKNNNVCEFSNLEIAKKIIKIIYGKEDDLYLFVEDRKGHDFRYSLNGYKSKQLLNNLSDYRQECLPGLENTFDTYLEHTIMWYKNNLDWWTK